MKRYIFSKRTEIFLYWERRKVANHLAQIKTSTLSTFVAERDVYQSHYKYYVISSVDKQWKYVHSQRRRQFSFIENRKRILALVTIRETKWQTTYISGTARLALHYGTNVDDPPTPIPPLPLLPTIKHVQIGRQQSYKDVVWFLVWLFLLFQVRFQGSERSNQYTQAQSPDRPSKSSGFNDETQQLRE